MEHKRRGKKSYSTQRVDFETVAMIKSLVLNLMGRGLKVKQSDLLNYALRFVKENELEFIEFIEEKGEEPPKKSGGILDTIFDTASKPWFPYGDLGG